MFDQVISSVYVCTCVCFGVDLDLDVWEGLGVIPMRVITS